MRNNDALTAEDVAEILQVSRSSVYKLVKTDELASYYVGRKLRFTMADVENYIARSRKAKAREVEAALGQAAGVASGAAQRGAARVLAAPRLRLARWNALRVRTQRPMRRM